MSRSDVVWFLCLCVCVTICQTKEPHKVHCSKDLMRVEIEIPTADSDDGHPPQIYLEGLKGYPKALCRPSIQGTRAEFRLSLSDIYECGVTRVVNQITGTKVYYHKIIIEALNSKETVNVKCNGTGPLYNDMMNGSGGRETAAAHASSAAIRVAAGPAASKAPVTSALEYHGIVRRDILPADFQEPDDLEITTSLTERAPEPHLSIGVTQNGKKVTGDLTVTPGTPLTMEINLDRDSAPIYGLSANHLDVTDTKTRAEVIVANGCTLDSYLFENFNTTDGDTLTAKFKAFKFPDSTFVQFRATVNVCLDKCHGMKCSNHQTGYGRRRREVSETYGRHLMDTKKMYEISLATFVKIENLEGVKRNEVLQLEEKLRELKLTNQRLARNSRGSFGDESKTFEQMQMVVPAFVVDERSLDRTMPNDAAALAATSIAAPVVSLIVVVGLVN